MRQPVKRAMMRHTRLMSVPSLSNLPTSSMKFTELKHLLKSAAVSTKVPLRSYMTLQCLSTLFSKLSMSVVLLA